MFKRSLIQFSYAMLLILPLWLFSNLLAADEPKTYRYIKLTLSDVYHPFLPQLDQNQWKKALLDTLTLKDVATHKEYLELSSAPIVFRDGSSVIFQIPTAEIVKGSPLYAIQMQYQRKNFKRFYALPIFIRSRCDNTSNDSELFHLFLNANSNTLAVLDRCAISPVTYSIYYELGDNIQQLVKTQNKALLTQADKDHISSHSIQNLVPQHGQGDWAPKRITMNKKFHRWYHLFYIPDSFYAQNLDDEIPNLDKRHVILSESMNVAGLELRKLTGHMTHSPADEMKVVNLLNAGKQSQNREQLINLKYSAPFQTGLLISYQGQMVGFEIRNNCGKKLRAVKLDISESDSWVLTVDTVDSLNANNPNESACQRILENMEYYKALKPRALEKELTLLAEYIDEMRLERPIMPEFIMGDDVAHY